MKTLRQFCAFALATILLLPACALLKKPIPVTQLQLTIDPAQLKWPTDISIASIKARGVLQTDRIIVTHGARVMQHTGVRWVANPAAQLSEQLEFAGRHIMTHTKKHHLIARIKSLEIQLQDFQIEVQSNSDTRVRVSVLASIRCKADGAPVQLPEAAASLALNSSEPQRIADRFNEALLVVFRKVHASSLGMCPAR